MTLTDPGELDELRDLVQQLDAVASKTRIAPTVIRSSTAATIAGPLLAAVRRVPGKPGELKLEIEPADIREVGREILRSSVWLTDELLELLDAELPQPAAGALAERIQAIEETLQAIETREDARDAFYDDLANRVDSLEKTAHNAIGSITDILETLGTMSHRIDQTRVNLAGEADDRRQEVNTLQEGLENVSVAIRNRLDDFETRLEAVANITAGARQELEQLERKVNPL